MSFSKQEQLDKEHKARFADISHRISKGKKVTYNEMFSYGSVFDSLKTPKIIIPSFDIERIRINYPFSKEIFVSICPKCKCVANAKDFNLLLEHNAITPILSGEYKDYPKSFIDTVISHPHISRYEYHFFRSFKLFYDATEHVCRHCVDERRKEIMVLLEKKGIHSKNYKIVDNLLNNLYPFVDSDYDLIEEFLVALKNDDIDLIHQIHDLSAAVQDIRTIQAFNARSTIPSDSFRSLVNSLKNQPDLFSINEALREEATSQVLRLAIPNNLPLEKFLITVEPYRKELSKIIDTILKDSKSHQEARFTKLDSRISELNENLLSLSKNKRFLFYNAGIAFLKSNKSILAASMVASILGISGSLLGCGISVASGVGIQIAKKYSKVKVPKEFQTLSNEISHSMRPSILKLISGSLRLDVQAVQLWNIKKGIGASSSNNKITR